MAARCLSTGAYELKTELTQELVRKFLDYDPETGVFHWKVYRAQNARAGQRAGHLLSRTGYIQILLLRGVYFAHRLAWMHHYGRWPDGHIDHINGVRDDNRIANLREATDQVNTQNQRRARSDCKSGYMGVRFHAQNKRWQARIGLPNGRQKSLGIYDTPEEAHQAYLTAKRQLHEGCTI